MQGIEKDNHATGATGMLLVLASRVEVNLG